MTTDRLIHRASKTRILGIVAAFAALAALLVPATPADADTVTGAVAFACQADLPEFPSASNTGDCDDGTLPAAALGVGAGLDNGGNPYVVAGNGDFRADFNYLEPCSVSPDGAPPVTGEANGTATISGVPAVHNNTVTDATLTANFDWIRVGLAAVITTAPAHIEFGDGAADADAATGGLAVAAFAPLNPHEGNHNCPAPGTQLDAQVVGVFASPA